MAVTRKVARERPDASGLQAIEQRVEPGKVRTRATQHEYWRCALGIRYQQPGLLLVACEVFVDEQLSARSRLVELPFQTLINARFQLPGVPRKPVGAAIRQVGSLYRAAA